MPDEIRVNRPQQMQQPMHQQAEMMPQAKSSKAPWIILLVIVVVLAVLGFLFRGQLFKGQGSSMAKGTDAADKASGYQAVFLTNGQVYFGKITNPNGDYVTLADIYYLQVAQNPAQGSGATTTPQQNITLVKLGQELHGPVDEMHISRAQILFYEDLKSSGNVVSAINKDKADKAAAAQPAK